MKNVILFLIFISAPLSLFSQAGVSVTTDNSPAAATAILDVKSTTKGMLIPRMLTSQRIAIGSGTPATGLLVYDLTSQSFWFYNGTAWVELVGGYVSQLRDADNDTKVQVEESPDEDKIRFDLGGQEKMVLQQNIHNRVRLDIKDIGANTFVGEDAGLNSSGGFNAGFGFNALKGNVGGSFNTAAGYGSLLQNITGNNNTAIGHNALNQNVGNHRSTAIGKNAMVNANNIDAGLETFNTAVGYGALAGSPLPANNTGKHNTAVGDEALTSNGFGFGNTAVGASVLHLNTGGVNNTGIGVDALSNNLSGHGNIAIGANSLLNNTNGNFNIAIGTEALSANGNHHRSTAIGLQAMMFANNNNLGPIETFNTAVGYEALKSSNSSANNTGRFNTAIGDQAISKNTTGNYNTAIGVTALFNNTEGSYNTAIGTSTLELNTLGNRNTATGFQALSFNTTGNENTANGYLALLNNGTANQNTALGNSALHNQSYNPGYTWTSANVAVGSYALFANQPTSIENGINNTAIGTQALYNNSTGFNNTAIGEQALLSNVTGHHNTVAGYHANVSTPSLTWSSAFGAAALVNAKDKIRIGDANIGTIEGQVDWTFPSDARFKYNIHDDHIPGLAIISKLRPVTYQFDTRKFEEHLMQHLPDSIRQQRLAMREQRSDNARIQTGFLAQEVEQLCAELNYSFSGLHIPENETDNYGLAYGSFVPLLVKAVQEQQLQIEELKNENTRLKAGYDRLSTEHEHRWMEQQEQISALQLVIDNLKMK